MPARPDVFSVNQPDGTSLRVRLTGDEYFHYLTTDDGFLIVEDEADHQYCYAIPSASGDPTPVSSGIKALNAENRSAADRAFLAAQPTDDMLQALQNEGASVRLKSCRRGP